MMHTLNKRLHESDDEEDLEVLRLAALQSLKKPTLAPAVVPLTQDPPAQALVCTPTVFTVNSKSVNKRGRYLGNGRIARNGAYHNWTRNTNLISVPTIEPDTELDGISNKKLLDKPPPKLILPQDRYCGSKIFDEKLNEGGSKFDRYNDSDASGTESESEHEPALELQSPKKLERAESFETLLQELENEIQGISKPPPVDTPKPEVKPKTKVKKQKIARKSSTEDQTDCKVKDVEANPITVETIDPKTKIISEKCDNEPEITVETSEVSTICDSNFSTSKLTLTPISNQNVLQDAVAYVNLQTPVVPTVMPYTPIYPHFQGPIVYNNVLPYPFPNLSAPVEPLRNIHPIPPLTISTDVLNTITAPLSPRSAAFVLQNREIVERRKKSPRRSYSRSPSPEYRGSVSPRYRRSPKRSPHTSPVRRISPTRNITRRLSPKSNSRHCSPKHSIESPRRHNRHRSAKLEVENKINVPNKSVELYRSPTPESESRAHAPSDAVLEARRKKFESGNVIATEGVIRLKAKEDAIIKAKEDAIIKANEDDNIDNKEEETEDFRIEEVTEEVLDTDDQEDTTESVLGGDELDLEITSNDIFSDEESDTDNEGRFKFISKERTHISKVPFTELLNETSKMIRDDNFNGSQAIYTDRSHTKSSSSHSKHRKLASTRLGKLFKNELLMRVDSKTLKRKRPMVSPIENKKIEIKIRNPSKYEGTNSSSRNTKGDRIDNTRKIEVSNLPNNTEEDKNLKLLNDCDDDSRNEGDLRTQLSRKRAERQNKQPAPDGVSSRLLQSALQGAIYKKSYKVHMEKEIPPLDGKLPIHLRLGIPGSLDIISDPTVQKSSRTRNKSRGNLDQV